MHPYQHAVANPDRLAFVVADTGEQLTYRELDEGSNRAANLFRALGLRPGDVVGLMVKNSAAFPVAYWGAQRSGLVVCPLSTHLRAVEAAYILRDCGAKLLITSAEVGEAACELVADRKALMPGLLAAFSTEGGLVGARTWEAELARMPTSRITDEVSGYYLVYSSGTTGRPKGVVLSFERGVIENETSNEQAIRARLEGLSAPIVFSGAPLYHAAPLVQLLGAHRVGGLAVVLKKFDPVAALTAIERWRVTSAQFVPTMFVRMLALPQETRERYDVSSLEQVLHSAAPCPIETKRQMLDWFGLIIHEYYSGTEAAGGCRISPEEWLRKPGSVGRASWGVIHICDEAGDELPAGQDGLIYFESERGFEYLNDPEKTARAQHPRHPTWSALGDIGHVDEDGYLFLTDRKDFMIISGGVNIYPQAVENLLISHPKVLDAAVIGAPHPEYGEEVRAVVEPAHWADAGESLAEELKAYCREHIAGVNVPRTVDFVQELPRLPTGKLAKHELRLRYWPADKRI